MWVQKNNHCHQAIKETAQAMAWSAPLVPRLGTHTFGLSVCLTVLTMTSHEATQQDANSTPYYASVLCGNKCILDIYIGHLHFRRFSTVPGGFDVKCACSGRPWGWRNTRSADNCLLVVLAQKRDETPRKRAVTKDAVETIRAGVSDQWAPWILILFQVGSMGRWASYRYRPSPRPRKFWCSGDALVVLGRCPGGGGLW